MPVAYIPGLVMRRAAELYPGQAKTDVTRLTNRLRDALTSISPALERALGLRLKHRGVCDLLAKYPTMTALSRISKSKTASQVAKNSPRMGDKIAEAVRSALEAQSVTVPGEQK